MKQAEDQYMYNQLNRKSRREVDKKTHNKSKLLRFPTKEDDNHCLLYTDHDPEA